MTAIKTRLGIYCPGVGTGGPWRYVHSVLAGLDPAEFDVTVFCDLPGPYAPRPWVNVVRLGGPPAPPGPPPPLTAVAASRRGLPPPLLRWAGFAQEARRLARVFRAHPVDLLHTQCTGCEESPVAARLAGVPRVLGTFHVNSSLDLHGVRSGPSYRVLEHVSNRCLDAAIAVSHATRRDWVARTHIPAGRVVAIHNGIDPEEYRPTPGTDVLAKHGIDPEQPFLLFVGRITRQKGIIHLVNAIPRIDPALQIVLCAGAPDTPEIGREMEEGVAKVAAQRPGVIWIREMISRPEVIQLYTHAAVFCCPSVYEPFGIINLEAMACETAVVASAVGGIPEVVVPNETGFLVDPGLVPGTFDPADPVAFSAGLADAINELAQNPALRARFAKAGRERAIAHFSWDAIAQTTVALYRSVMEQRAEIE